MSTAVVLDPSAIRAYALGSVAVGELLMLLGEDGDRAALPAVAMADAWSDLAHVEMLTYLMGHERTDVVPLDGSVVGEVGMLAGLTSLPLAHAIITARRLDTYLVTAQPKTLEGLIDRRMLIEI